MIRNLIFLGHCCLEAWGLVTTGQKLSALLPAMTTALLLSMLF
ncbi:hypothetical protein [Rhodocaloribacter sp.]